MLENICIYDLKNNVLFLAGKNKKKIYSTKIFTNSGWKVFIIENKSN